MCQEVRLYRRRLRGSQSARQAEPQAADQNSERRQRDAVSMLRFEQGEVSVEL